MIAVLILIGAMSGNDSEGGDTAAEDTATEGGNTAAPEQEAPAEEAPAEEAPAEEATADGAPVTMGETVNMNRVEVTASNLRNDGTDALGNNHVCADASLVNAHDDSLSFSQFDWELQDPSGVVRNSTFTASSNFESIELAPGGNYSGTLCFEGDATPGEYVLSFQEGFIGGEANWTGQL